MNAPVDGTPTLKTLEFVRTADCTVRPAAAPIFLVPLPHACDLSPAAEINRDSLAGCDSRRYDRRVSLTPSNYGPKSRFLSPSTGPGRRAGCRSRSFVSSK